MTTLRLQGAKKFAWNQENELQLEFYSKLRFLETYTSRDLEKKKFISHWKEFAALVLLIRNTHVLF